MLHVQRADDHAPRLIAKEPLKIGYPALRRSAEATVAPKLGGMDSSQKRKPQFALEPRSGQRRSPIVSMHKVEWPDICSNAATAGKESMGKLHRP